MKANIKTHISAARTKFIAVRKVVEADRMRRLEPLKQGFKRTVKLELDHIREMTNKIIEKITQDEQELLENEDGDDTSDDESSMTTA